MFWAQLTKKKYALPRNRKKKQERYVYYVHQTALNFSDLFERKHCPE